MLAPKTWFALAALAAIFAGWLAFQPQSVVYSEREIAGVVYQSKVDCGVGVAIVFAGRFDPSVPGPSTQADCLKIARTRVAELFGLAVTVGLLVFVGIRYGKEPPRPISAELPDLPHRRPAVEGRSRGNAPPS